jgi:hypothetical protein
MTTHRHGFVAAAATALLATSTAFAQAPAAPAPADMPKPKCEAPGDYPAKLASETRKASWIRSRDAYFECLKKFIREEQAAAEPHTKAANAATTEYNDAVKRYNEQMGAN